MFKHQLVEASDVKELSAKLLPLTDIKVFKPATELNTRELAFGYLQTRTCWLQKVAAIAVPVRLPVTPNYTRELSELHRLSEHLKDAVRPWARARLETKVVAQAERLRYMEQTTTDGILHWAVYSVEDKSNGQLVPNRPPLQRFNPERSHA